MQVVQENTQAQLAAMSVAQLRELCLQIGEPYQGTRNEVARRLKALEEERNAPEAEVRPRDHQEEVPPMHCCACESQAQHQGLLTIRIVNL